MKTNRTSLYISDEVEQAMKQLASEHDRSLNGEIVQACKAWIERSHHSQKISENIQNSSDAPIVSDK